MIAENSSAIATVDSLIERLLDADAIPGRYSVFTDDEAAFLGAFEEDAISDESAMAGSYFNPDLVEEVERELRL